MHRVFGLTLILVLAGCGAVPTGDVPASVDLDLPAPTLPAEPPEAAPANIPPVADAGPDIEDDATTGSGPQVSGLRSSDPDGEITSYIWTSNDGLWVSGPDPVLTGLPVGKTVVTLEVRDDDGATDTDEIVITRRGPKVGLYRRCYGFGQGCYQPDKGSIRFDVSQDSAGLFINGLTYSFGRMCVPGTGRTTDYFGSMSWASILGTKAHLAGGGVSASFEFYGGATVYDKVAVTFSFPSNYSCLPYQVQMVFAAD